MAGSTTAGGDNVTPEKVGLFAGSLIAIAIGVADAWLFGKFGLTIDGSLILLGLGGLGLHSLVGGGGSGA